MKIIVIGGGAAGFFSAINIGEKNPNATIKILEKSSKLLQKVKVSGGGRCNVTNTRSNPAELIKYYPRGNKKLYPVFKNFNTDSMVRWLQDRSVETSREDDLRIFPKSNSSQTVINCFTGLANKLKIEILTNQQWTDLEQTDDLWVVHTKSGRYQADKVVIATGSSPSSWKILEHVGLSISKIVPSLFTFNIKDERIKQLQGISFHQSTVRVAGTKFSESGPLLITHWGLSGPAILKLSSIGAYELNGLNYQFEILINFIGVSPTESRNHLVNYKNSHPKRTIHNYPLFELPKRFWEMICTVAGISPTTPFNELSKKHLNKIVEELTQGRYKVNGKSTFKEEFVTAGGVELSEIDLNTFECKSYPGLYLAGEVLDIDALTGGFNFQACWSAGWLISEALSK